MSVENYLKEQWMASKKREMELVAGLFLKWARKIVEEEGVEELTSERMAADLEIPKMGSGLPTTKATPKTVVSPDHPCEWLFKNCDQYCGRDRGGEQWVNPETGERYKYCHACMMKTSVVSKLPDHPGLEFVKAHRPGRKTAAAKSTAARPSQRATPVARSAPAIKSERFHPSIKPYRFTTKWKMVMWLDAQKQIFVLGTWDPETRTINPEVNDEALKEIEGHTVKLETDEPEQVAARREELEKELERIDNSANSAPSMPDSFAKPRAGFRRSARDEDDDEGTSARTSRYQRRSAQADDDDDDVPRTRTRVPRRRAADEDDE